MVTVNKNAGAKILHDKAEPVITVLIEKHGFVIVPGDDDAVMAQLSISVSSPGQDPMKIKFPSKDQKSNKELLRYPLKSVKTDSALIEALFNSALESVFHQLKLNLDRLSQSLKK